MSVFSKFMPPSSVFEAVFEEKLIAEGVFKQHTTHFNFFKLDLGEVPKK